MPGSLTYADYLNRVRPYIGQGGGSEAAGSGWQPVGEDAWRSMTPQERYQEMANSAPGDPAGGGGPLDADPETAAAFRQRFGSETWGPTASGRPDSMGRLVYGFGNTRMIGQDDPSQFAIDPSRVMQLPDGRWVMEDSNIRGQYLQQAQATDDRRNNQNVTRTAAALAAGAGAAMYGAGALGGTAAPTGGTFGTAGGLETLPMAATGGGSGALAELPTILSEGQVLGGAGGSSLGGMYGGLDAIQAGENVGSVLGGSSGGSMGGMYSSPAFAGGSAAPGAGVVAPGMQGAANLDTFLINNGMTGMAGTDAAGLVGNGLSSAGSSIANNPMRALQLAQLLASVGGGLAHQDDGGDSGPSELGSMGWKPPEMGEYHPAMYDPQYQSPFTGWQDQYQQSLRPLGRMYGR